MEEYVISQGKELRCGYTTGSCGTAAAKAATYMLFFNERIAKIKIDTPKGVTLDLDVEEVLLETNKVTCAIRKDSGDDPDDTNGILIFATVEKLESGAVLPDNSYCENELVLKGETIKTNRKIYVTGGVGVGKVTKEGLSCKVNGYAINPVPCKMITNELVKFLEQAAVDINLLVTIFIPEGKEIAKKTFNPRLGILEGLSILGTSGIVEPMSEKALVETMYTEMNVQKSKGNKNLLVFFGNYGEDFTKNELQIDITDAVTCSNFVGELLDYAVYLGFESLLLIGHSGKLVKLAQGVMNTHSKYADCRNEAIALSAMLHGASIEVGKELQSCITTDEMIKVLERENLVDSVIKDITIKIDFYMQQRVHNKIKTGALMFSNVYGILGKTKDADDLIKLHRRVNDEKR